jgi:hypothetical protein
MNRRTPLTPRENRRLVPRAARVHAMGGPFFISLEAETEPRPLRWLYGSRRATGPNLSQCVIRGPRFGKHLGPFFDASSSNAKKKDRCLWLGNGLSSAQPSTHDGLSSPRGSITSTGQAWLLALGAAMPASVISGFCSHHRAYRQH